MFSLRCTSTRGATARTFSVCSNTTRCCFSSFTQRRQGRNNKRRGRLDRRGSKSAAFKTFPTTTTNQVPSLALAKSMPVSLKMMDNASLTALGASGNHKALEEMLKRHIMATDNISYDKASEIYMKIEEKNHEWENVMAFPFQTAILVCGFGGFIAIPLVFHLPTVEFFNEHFVTAEHPPMKELETSLETASWSWNWMEPVLGTSTFLLLCLQYMRMNLQHLGVNPYTARMKKLRGRHVADAFPQYNQELLIAYSEATPFYNAKDLWF